MESILINDEPIVLNKCSIVQVKKCSNMLQLWKNYDFDTNVMYYAIHALEYIDARHWSTATCLLCYYHITITLFFIAGSH